GGILPGLVYRAPAGFGGVAYWSRPWGATHTWRASGSYFTSAHNLKVGGTYVRHMSTGVSFYNDDRLAYRFLNGVPINSPCSGCTEREAAPLPLLPLCMRRTSGRCIG